MKTFRGTTAEFADLLGADRAEAAGLINYLKRVGIAKEIGKRPRQWQGQAQHTLRGAPVGNPGFRRKGGGMNYGYVARTDLDRKGN